MSKSVIRILVLALLALVSSCRKEVDTPTPEPVPTPPAAEGRTIHYKATVQAGAGTRATLDNELKYVFEEGDRVYMESTDGQMYGFLSLSVDDGEGKSIALFEGKLTCVGDFTPSPDTPVTLVLVSPEDDLHTITGGKVDEVNSASYLQDKWAASLTEAVRHQSHFTGSGLFGATRFTLDQQSCFLKCNVRFKTSETPVNSTVTASLYNNQSDTPLRTASITVQTAGSVPFVFAFEDGETLSDAVLHVEWGNSEKDFPVTDHTLAANNYYSISRSALHYDGFHIRAKNDGTDVTFKFNDGIEFSEDFGENWTTYDGRTFHLNADDVVCFKGNRADCNCSGNTQPFTATKVCYIAGEIASLLGYPATLPASAFRGAFSRKNTTDTGNNGSDMEKPTAISVDTSKPADYVDWVDIDPTDPLILPATTAAECYMDMFLGCISLTHAPDLPATVLADKCYFRMFHSCTKLTSMPSYPSVVTMSGSSTRRRYCYQMFQSSGIKELTEPLPVGQNSTLERGCFEDMFARCSSLTSVIPGLLPATTLAADCYRGMFQYTRFKRAPDLLATTLVSYCYRYMFYNCTQLNYIKCLATNPYSSDNNNAYTRDWVGGSIPGSGTFIKNNDEEMTSSWATGAVYGIHSGWTAYQVKDEPAE